MEREVRKIQQKPRICTDFSYSRSFRDDSIPPRGICLMQERKHQIVVRHTLRQEQWVAGSGGRGAEWHRRVGVRIPHTHNLHTHSCVPEFFLKNPKSRDTCAREGNRMSMRVSYHQTLASFPSSIFKNPRGPNRTIQNFHHRGTLPIP